jgi:hypothetical protein
MVASAIRTVPNEPTDELGLVLLLFSQRRPYRSLAAQPPRLTYIGLDLVILFCH